MGFKDNLVKVAKQTTKKVGERIAFGFDRADELGGELRDYFLERTDSPVLRKVGERMAKLGGLSVDEADGPSPYEKSVAAAAAKGPPPTAASLTAEAAKQGLGDAAVAAQIYGRDSCPWTGRAITLLNAGKIDFDYVELDDPDHRRFENELVSETKQETVPYVFLRGAFVGGYNELNEIVRLGQLDYHTLPDDQRKALDAAGKGPTKIAER